MQKDMKLINYTKKEVVANERWAIAIKNRFGDAQSLLMKLNPDVQEYCSDRLRLLCADDTMPTLVRVSIVYGNKVSETLLNTHLTEAIITMGEKNVEADEIKLIARTIRADENLRTLNVAMILHFFKRLKSGQFKIFGAVTPRKIMECMQAFSAEAKELEHSFRLQAEKEQREAERREHEKVAISLSEYAKKNNINPADLRRLGYTIQDAQ